MKNWTLTYLGTATLAMMLATYAHATPNIQTVSVSDSVSASAYDIPTALTDPVEEEEDVELEDLSALLERLATASANPQLSATGREATRRFLRMLATHSADRQFSPDQPIRGCGSGGRGTYCCMDGEVGGPTKVCCIDPVYGAWCKIFD